MIKRKFKGIYKGDELSNEDYHLEKKHLSSSNYKTLISDIEKFYTEKILGKKEVIKKNVFDEGSLVHGLILEPHLVDSEFAMFPGLRKIGKEWNKFKDAELSNLNRTILSKAQWKRCEGLVKGFHTNPTAVEMVKKSDKELSLFGLYENIPTKVRADLINIDEGYIADIKTTSYDTDLDSFKFTIKDFEYDLSAALYTIMFENHFNRPFDFYWIVLGKKDRSCEIYKMSKKTRSDGERKIIEAVKLYKKCVKTGIWKRKKVDLSNVKCYNDYEILEV